MKESLNFVVNVNPRSKKNSQEIVFNRKTGKRMVIQNKRYTEFEKECKQYMPKLDKPIDYPINLQCKFYVCDARKRDIANYLEAIQDVLVKYKVLEDDNYNIVSSLNGCSMEIDRENNRIEITITKKENE
jgi:Holliday junction resolvase RusA-like endonuclease